MPLCHDCVKTMACLGVAMLRKYDYDGMIFGVRV